MRKIMYFVADQSKSGKHESEENTSVNNGFQKSNDQKISKSLEKVYFLFVYVFNFHKWTLIEFLPKNKCLYFYLFLRAKKKKKKVVLV